MRIEQQNNTLLLYKEADCIGRCRFAGQEGQYRIEEIFIAPEWRRKGYGSYLIKQLLHRTGGYDTGRETLYTLPAPEEPGLLAFWQKFRFIPRGDMLYRRRVPEPSAVGLVQQFLLPRLKDARLLVDATCGNGNDTAFLAKHAGPDCTLLAFDIQQQAVDNTGARLAALPGCCCRWQVIKDSHANLLQYVQPGTADAILFNFGWLPGADHTVYSQPGQSLPALQAALTALRPGGVLTAVLYSGKVIGDGEKQAALGFLRALPLTEYTVLECSFANWADTAPLPLLVLKKEK